MIVHHNNKSDQGGPIGSIHIQGHMDLVIKAEAKKGYHKISFEKVKDDDTPPSQAYQIESGLESGWIRWEGEAKNAEARHDADTQDILAALNEHPGEWMTVNEILEYVPINKQKAHRILTELTKQRDFGVEKQLMDSGKKPSKSNPLQFRTFVHSSGYLLIPGRTNIRDA